MARFGAHEVADVTVYDLVTNKPVLFLDSLKLTNMDTKADTSYATGGRGGGRIISWDFNKTATFNIQNAVLDPKAFALQAGMSDVAKGTVNIYKREVITVDASGDATLAEAPVGSTLVLYSNAVSMDGYTHDAELVVTQSTLTPTTYTITAKAIAVDATTFANKQLIAYYEYASDASAEMIELNASKYPGFYKIIGDTVVRNITTGEDEPFQILIPRAKLLPTFNLQLHPDGEPTVFDFNMEVYKDPATGSMVKFIKY